MKIKYILFILFTSYSAASVAACPQMLLAQLIHSINCDEHDGQGSHVINHEMSSLVVPR